MLGGFSFIIVFTCKHKISDAWIKIRNNINYYQSKKILSSVFDTEHMQYVLKYEK